MSLIPCRGHGKVTDLLAALYMLRFGYQKIRGLFQLSATQTWRIQVESIATPRYTISILFVASIDLMYIIIFTYRYLLPLYNR